ncbi:MAG: MATE family efflux transporter [Gemmatimonadaceae bacterium]|jgi:MATE family multidrug resistance protein|nr:MATE family efflux transporter [Gemmatimonadaceae bacterium]
MPSNLTPPSTRWPTRGELREMARLAAPIALVNLAMMSMGVVDTLMLGHFSADALAAGALGNLYFYAVAMFGLGVVAAIDPLVSQAVGARDDAGVARAVQRGLVIAVGVAVVVGAALLAAGPALRALRQPADLVPDAAAYAAWSAASTVPFFAFNVVRSALQAINRLRAIVIAVVFANVVNVVGNWALIFGHLGSDAMGVEGSALSTLASRWIMLGVLVLLAWEPLRPALRPWRADTWQWGAIGRVVAIGTPIGFQFMAEVFAFHIVTIFMGWLGKATLAAHEITLNLASLTFMVPMGVSGAASVMVGRAIGAGDMDAARRDARAAYLCGVGFMAFAALLFLLAPTWLATRYTRDVDVVAITAALIPIAGVFQLFDGGQVVGIGILRGSGDTRIPMVLHLAAFWGIGFPLCWYLGFSRDLGAVGLWWGLAVGLLAAAVLQALRVRTRLRGDVQRVLVDAPAVG